MTSVAGTREEAPSRCERGETSAASVRLGPEHARPLLESLSVLPSKRALFAVDSYFRDGWEDLCELPAADIELILNRHALLLLKPDAVVGRRLEAALTWLAGQGTVVAVERVRISRHVARAMWQYQWNVASRDRRDLADLIGGSGDSLLLLVRLPPAARPATVRLSAAKGPADPARREPGQLRHRLGNENLLLNFVHAADEPADLVRELAVLLDSADRRRLLRRLPGATDVTDQAWTQIRELHERYPAREIGLTAFVHRQHRRLGELPDGRRGRPAEAFAAALSGLESGGSPGWRELCALAERAGLPLDPWDRIVVGTHLMLPSEPGTVPLLTGPPATAWDRRPAPTSPARSSRSLESVLVQDRPVSHRLVHKAGLEEVMVTGSAAVTDDVLVLAAQLPLIHPYLSDLPARAVRYDTMALLELCRQAAYVVIHRHLEVPLDRCFLLQRLRLELFPELAFADQPGPLRAELEFEIRRRFTAPRPGLIGRLRLSRPDRRPIAAATMSVGWRSPSDYETLRAGARAAAGLPRPVGPPPPARSGRATPAQVGRTLPANVLLAGRAGSGPEFSADLVIDTGYRALFNHPQDHVPGLFLIESARQAAFRAVSLRTGAPPGALALTMVDAAFTAMTELDLPVHCVATPDRAEGETGGSTTDLGVDVVLSQNGDRRCRIGTTVTVRRPGSPE